MLSKLNSNNMSRGFTLIELLVVIAIIGILSTVVLANISGARKRAQEAVLISALKQVELGLLMLAEREGRTFWWPESDFGFGSNPDISELITDTNRLGKTISQDFSMPIGTNMGYDNDQNVFVCGDGGTIYRGVNVHIRNVPLDRAEAINQTVDNDGTLLCGKIKWDPSGGGSLFYVLSEDPTIGM